jgi:hypothetical protein
MGDTAMTALQQQIATLVAIRAAHHPETTPKYDRVVFEFRGALPLIEVEYVKQLFADGSGLPVQIIGAAFLQIQFKPAQAHNDKGQATAPARITVNLPIVKEIASAGDFEALVTYGIGLSRKAEIRVITMANPNRVVIDIIH